MGARWPSLLPRWWRARRQVGSVPSCRARVSGSGTRRCESPPLPRLATTSAPYGRCCTPSWAPRCGWPRSEARTVPQSDPRGPSSGRNSCSTSCGRTCSSIAGRRGQGVRGGGFSPRRHSRNRRVFLEGLQDGGVAVRAVLFMDGLRVGIELLCLAFKPLGSVRPQTRREQTAAATLRGMAKEVNDMRRLPQKYYQTNYSSCAYASPPCFLEARDPGWRGQRGRDTSR